MNATFLMSENTALLKNDRFINIVLPYFSNNSEKLID